MAWITQCTVQMAYLLWQYNNPDLQDMMPGTLWQRVGELPAPYSRGCNRIQSYGNPQAQWVLLLKNRAQNSPRLPAAGRLAVLDSNFKLLPRFSGCSRAPSSSKQSCSRALAVRGKSDAGWHPCPGTQAQFMSPSGPCRTMEDLGDPCFPGSPWLTMCLNKTYSVSHTMWRYRMWPRLPT